MQLHCRAALEYLVRTSLHDGKKSLQKPLNISSGVQVDLPWKPFLPLLLLLHSILQSSALQLPLWGHWFVKISEAAVEIGLQSEIKHTGCCVSAHCSLVGTLPTVQRRELIYIHRQFHRDDGRDVHDVNRNVPWSDSWSCVKSVCLCGFSLFFIGASVTSLSVLTKTSIFIFTETNCSRRKLKPNH